MDLSDLSEGLFSFRTDGSPGLTALADAPAFTLTLHKRGCLKQGLKTCHSR